MYSTFSLSLDKGISRHLPDKKKKFIVLSVIRMWIIKVFFSYFSLMFGVFIFFCVSCPCTVCLKVVTKKQRNLKYTSSKMHLYNCCSDVTGKENRKDIEY